MGFLTMRRGYQTLAADGRCLEEGVAANYSIFTSIILSKTNTTIFKIGYRWPFSNFTVFENYPKKSHLKVKHTGAKTKFLS